MKVSVVIPTFNRIKLLERAVNSVIRQTKDPYEIIVVDDGSDDDGRRRWRRTSRSNDGDDGR